MNSLAVLAPWPPQHSGIADYAFDLVRSLQRPGLAISVYTTETSPRNLAGIEIHTVSESSDLSELSGYDCRLYQLGNNTQFHLWMLPLLRQFPGVIHVHDMVMHHIAAWATWMQGDAEAYLGLISKWYGLSGRKTAEQALEQQQYLWDSERVTEFPLCEEYLQEASAIIVHSAFALHHIRTSVPHVPSFQIDQLYDLEPRVNAANRLERIVVLGGVDPQKRLDWVIEALGSVARIQSDARPIRLQVAGNVDPRCETLVEKAAIISRPDLQIEFLGRVDEERFHQLFYDADLCVALRCPTMGETSAIVMKALQIGVPTIVNDIGWYSELPDNIVKKLPVDSCAEHLRELLEYLLNEGQAYSNWSNHCQEFAITGLSSRECAEQYLEICSNPSGIELVSDVFVAALRDCGLEGNYAEAPLLDAVIEQSLF